MDDDNIDPELVVKKNTLSQMEANLSGASVPAALGSRVVGGKSGGGGGGGASTGTARSTSTAAGS